MCSKQTSSNARTSRISKTSIRVPFNILVGLHLSAFEALLLKMQQDNNIADKRWIAYMLATVKHECADTWNPIAEIGNLEYFDRYNSGTAIGRQLGNTQPGDGFKYRGRGYVQITGRGQYKKLGDALGVNLVAKPQFALDKQIAYEIMSIGMRAGMFTGKKLSDYINSDKCDFLNARRIINGTDNAGVIARYANDYLHNNEILK